MKNTPLWVWVIGAIGVFTAAQQHVLTTQLRTAIAVARDERRVGVDVVRQNNQMLIELRKKCGDEK